MKKKKFEKINCKNDFELFFLYRKDYCHNRLEIEQTNGLQTSQGKIGVFKKRNNDGLSRSQKGLNQERLTVDI